MKRAESPQSAGQAENLSIAPEPPEADRWIRLPKKGEDCRFSGLSRTSLQKLVAPCKANRHAPPVKGSRRTLPGSAKPIWLVNLASLMAWVNEGRENLPSVKL